MVNHESRAVRKNKITRYLEVALYHSRKRRERRGICSTKYCTLVPVSAAQPSSTLFHSTYTYIHGNKWKIKEVDYIFVHQRCCLSQLCNVSIYNRTAIPIRTTFYYNWQSLPLNPVLTIESMYIKFGSCKSISFRSVGETRTLCQRQPKRVPWILH